MHSLPCFAVGLLAAALTTTGFCSIDLFTAFDFFGMGRSHTLCEGSCSTCLNPSLNFLNAAERAPGPTIGSLHLFKLDKCLLQVRWAIHSSLVIFLCVHVNFFFRQIPQVSVSNEGLLVSFRDRRLLCESDLICSINCWCHLN